MLRHFLTTNVAAASPTRMISRECEAGARSRDAASISTRWCSSFHTGWFALLRLLLCQIIIAGLRASNTFAAAAATECGAQRACSSEKIFEDCRSRGATENAQCFCSNGVPHACRDVCDSSELHDICLSQCRGYLPCKNIDSDADGSWKFGFEAFVSIIVAIAVAAAVIVAAILLRKRCIRLKGCVRTQTQADHEGGYNHSATHGVDAQEELTSSSQETYPPGNSSSSAFTPRRLSTEPEGAAFLEMHESQTP